MSVLFFDSAGRVHDYLRTLGECLIFQLAFIRTVQRTRERFEYRFSLNFGDAQVCYRRATDGVLGCDVGLPYSSVK